VILFVDCITEICGSGGSQTSPTSGPDLSRTYPSIARMKVTRAIQALALSVPVTYINDARCSSFHPGQVVAALLDLAAFSAPSAVNWLMIVSHASRGSNFMAALPQHLL
jgi:hypothetical protein